MKFHRKYANDWDTLSKRAKDFICTSVDDVRSSLGRSGVDVAMLREALAFLEKHRTQTTKQRMLRARIVQLTKTA